MGTHLGGLVQSQLRYNQESQKQLGWILKRHFTDFCKTRTSDIHWGKEASLKVLKVLYTVYYICNLLPQVFMWADCTWKFKREKSKLKVIWENNKGWVNLFGILNPMAAATAELWWMETAFIIFLINPFLQLSEMKCWGQTPVWSKKVFLCPCVPFVFSKTEVTTAAQLLLQCSAQDKTTEPVMGFVVPFFDY